MKSETHLTRLTVVCNLIDYPGDVITPTADLATLKLLLNNTISTLIARFMTGGIKTFISTPYASAMNTRD